MTYQDELDAEAAGIPPAVFLELMERLRDELELGRPQAYTRPPAMLVLRHLWRTGRRR